MFPRLIRKIIQKKRLSRIIILQIWNNFFQELKILTPRYQNHQFEHLENFSKMWIWENSNQIYPKRRLGRLENGWLSDISHGRVEKVWLYRNVFREIGESINIIILRMILFLEIGVLEKEWLYRNVFYIGMYFGRLIAFWETRKLKKDGSYYWRLKGC